MAPKKPPKKTNQKPQMREWDAEEQRWGDYDIEDEELEADEDEDDASDDDEE